MRQALDALALSIGGTGMAKVVKDELIRHGVSTLEKRAIFAAAKRRGLTISEFVRQLRVKAVR